MERLKIKELISQATEASAAPPVRRPKLRDVMSQARWISVAADRTHQAVTRLVERAAKGDVKLRGVMKVCCICNSIG